MVCLMNLPIHISSSGLASQKHISDASYIHLIISDEHNHTTILLKLRTENAEASSTSLFKFFLLMLAYASSHDSLLTTKKVPLFVW